MDSIFGKWTLESRDNVDAFLACRGVSWFLRTMILNMRADIEFTSENSNELIKKTHSKMGLRQESLPCPGSYEPAKTLSGIPEIGELRLDGEKLVQEMKMKGDCEAGGSTWIGGDVVAKIERQVIGEKLHVTMTCKNIVGKEVYKRL